MNPTRKQIEKDGQTYVFRFPTAMDMINIDKKALDIRGGVTEGLGAALQFSQGIATLNVLCEQPKEVDFGALDYDILNEMSSEVTDWVQNFRKPVGEKQDAVGNGQA